MAKVEMTVAITGTPQELRALTHFLGDAICEVPADARGFSLADMRFIEMVHDALSGSPEGREVK